MTDMGKTTSKATTSSITVSHEPSSTTSNTFARLDFGQAPDLALCTISTNSEKPRSVKAKLANSTKSSKFIEHLSEGTDSVCPSDKHFPSSPPSRGSSNSYINILQSASQRGFAAPPRHEIFTHSNRPLPSTPTLDIPPAEFQVQPQIARTMSFRSALRETEGLTQLSERNFQRSRSQSAKWMVGEERATWLARVEGRVAGVQKWRRGYGR